MYFIKNKKDIFQRYQEKKDIYKEYIVDFEDIYHKGKVLEERFYEKTLDAIHSFILHTEKIPVLLFDIDDTFISKGIENNNIDYIRPSFPYIVKKIRYIYPQAIFGTLSQRRNGPPPCVNNIFDSKFIICSHWYDAVTLSDNTYGFQDGSHRPIYVEKVNAYMDICKRYPNYSFLLIDDILSHDKTTWENPLVSNGKGYTVRKEDKFTFEYQLLWIISTEFTI